MQWGTVVITRIPKPKGPFVSAVWADVRVFQMNSSNVHNQNNQLVITFVLAVSVARAIVIFMVAAIVIVSCMTVTVVIGIVVYWFFPLLLLV